MITKTTITTIIINDDADEKEMIDWAAIVKNLHVRSSLKHIARSINCDERMLSNIKQGITVEPKFSTGVQLLAKHGLMFPEAHKSMGLS